MQSREAGLRGEQAAAEWLARFLFQPLQPITHDEIHAKVQRAVAALMAADGPVKA